MEEFILKGDFIELYKLLKAACLSESGGQAKHLIASGAVKVDGVVETRKAAKITAGMNVELNGRIIAVVNGK